MPGLCPGITRSQPPSQSICLVAVVIAHRASEKSRVRTNNHTPHKKMPARSLAFSSVQEPNFLFCRKGLILDCCGKRAHLLDLPGANAAGLRYSASHRQCGRDDAEQCCQGQARLAPGDIARSGVDGTSLGEIHRCGAHGVFLEVESDVSNIGASSLVSKFQLVLSAITAVNMIAQPIHAVPAP